MRLLKWIPEAGIAIGELDEGTQVRLTAATEAEALAIVKVEQDKKSAKQAEKAAEKADQSLEKLAKKAAAVLPDVLAYLAAARFRATVAFADALQDALNRLEA